MNMKTTQEFVVRPALSTSSLTKYYGKQKGIIDLTLEVPNGEVFGFLGPNGSGKTTCIRILMGYIRPTSGTASVLGLDSVKQSVRIRRRVGYLPGDVSLYGHLNGEEHLQMVQGIRGKLPKHKVKDLIERFEINMERKIRQCSRGMRQKVALLLAMAHDPEILIFDEPTSGLDPLMQQTLLYYLKDEQERGKTVFFSSHNLSEVEAVCDRVAIIKEGKLLVVNNVHEIAHHKQKHVSIMFDEETKIDLSGLKDMEIIREEKGRLKLVVKGDINELIRRLSKYQLLDVTISEPSLEQAFLKFFGKEDAS